MIPKLIHQTAPTTSLPPRCQAYVQKLRALHPDWTYRLWTDEDNDAFVQQHYPQFHPIFAGLPKNIMRADVIRYLLMHRLGGLYLDTDYEMLKPFDLLHHDIVLPWETDGDFGAGNDLVCNSIFAATPGHPLFQMAIDDLAAHPPAPDADVLHATGPNFLTGIYHRAVAAGIPVFTPPRQWFSPVTPQNPRQYQAIVESGISYGIHYCHGSWRQHSLATRAKICLRQWASRFR